MKWAILDDHPGIHVLMELTIRRLFPKSTCRFFVDSNEAIAYCSKNAIDFAISDIQIGESKRLDFANFCGEQKIPFMIYSSYLNISIIEGLAKLSCRAYVSKSSGIPDLKRGIKAVVSDSLFNCTIVEKYLSNASEQHDIPYLEFSKAELPVILAQINGESTVDLAKRLNKSKTTIRNQRINLALRCGCNMEEIARRYLYWHTTG
jgi:DNA-binding NarL/FixJ family response regulator